MRKDFVIWWGESQLSFDSPKEPQDIDIQKMDLWELLRSDTQDLVSFFGIKERIIRE